MTLLASRLISVGALEYWIPAFAGMTRERGTIRARHWIPACAGMTEERGNDTPRKTLDSRLRGNDRERRNDSYTVLSDHRGNKTCAVTGGKLRITNCWGKRGFSGEMYSFAFFFKTKLAQKNLRHDW